MKVRFQKSSGSTFIASTPKSSFFIFLSRRIAHHFRYVDGSLNFFTYLHPNLFSHLLFHFSTLIIQESVTFTSIFVHLFYFYFESRHLKETIIRFYFFILFYFVWYVLHAVNFSDLCSNHEEVFFLVAVIALYLANIMPAAFRYSLPRFAKLVLVLNFILTLLVFFLTSVAIYLAGTGYRIRIRSDKFILLLAILRITYYLAQIRRKIFAVALLIPVAIYFAIYSVGFGNQIFIISHNIILHLFILFIAHCLALKRIIFVIFYFIFVYLSDVQSDVEHAMQLAVFFEPKNTYVSFILILKNRVRKIVRLYVRIYLMLNECTYVPCYSCCVFLIHLYSFQYIFIGSLPVLRLSRCYVHIMEKSWKIIWEGKLVVLQSAKFAEKVTNLKNFIFLFIFLFWSLVYALFI